MADSLESMFRYLGPATAGMFAGEREGLASQQSQADTAYREQQLQDLFQANAQREKTNPLDLQKMILENQTKEVQLPGFKANSDKAIVDARKVAKTEDADVAKTVSESSLKQLELQQTQASWLHENLTREADIVNRLPENLRKQYILGKVKEYGGDVADWDSKLSSIPAGHLGTVVEEMGKKYALTAARHVQEMDKQKGVLENAKAIAAGHDRTQLDVAEMRKQMAEAKKRLGDNVLQNIMTKFPDPAKASVALRVQAEQETDPELKQKFMNLANEFAQKAAEIPQAGKADLNAINIKPNVVTPYGSGTGQTGKHRKPLSEH